MFIGWLLRWGAPFLMALFPLPVVAQLVVVLLRSLAKKTKNTTDDQLVAVLERYFNVPPIEEKKDGNS